MFKDASVGDLGHLLSQMSYEAIADAEELPSAKGGPTQKSPNGAINSKTMLNDRDSE